jgi:hypothetical protein
VLVPELSPALPDFLADGPGDGRRLRPGFAVGEGDADADADGLSGRWVEDATGLAGCVVVLLSVVIGSARGGSYAVPAMTV